MFVLKYVNVKYFRGYHRPTKINRNEYLTHEWFSHENFPIYGINIVCHNFLPKNYGSAVLATKGLPETQSAIFIKVSRWMLATHLKEGQPSASQ